MLPPAITVLSSVTKAHGHFNMNAGNNNGYINGMLMFVGLQNVGEVFQRILRYVLNWYPTFSTL